MNRVIVIAVGADRRTFAVENEAGICAVFALQESVAVMPGEILCGAMPRRGAQVLGRAGSTVPVTGQSGPLTRAQALAQVDGRSPD